MMVIDVDEFKRRMSGVYEEYMWEVLEDMPTVELEPLTDAEQRIFLAAMVREAKYCKQIEELWDELSLTSDEDLDLLRTCDEIKRKVKKALWTEE